MPATTDSRSLYPLRRAYRAVYTESVPIFKTKLRHIKLTLSPFSPEQMQQIGQRWVDAIKLRTAFALDLNDQPAPPLSKQYARRKLQYGRTPIRDWRWTGLTMASLKVKSASNNQVRIGFTHPAAVVRVNGIQKYGAMWGTSPKDRVAVNRAVTEQLVRISTRIKVEKMA